MINIYAYPNLPIIPQTKNPTKVGLDGRKGRQIRHAFNQNLTLAGVDDTDRIQLMGQKSIKMQQTYTHADIENLRCKLVKAIPHVELLN